MTGPLLRALRHTLLAALAAPAALAADLPSKKEAAPAPVVEEFMPWMVRVRALAFLPQSSANLYAAGNAIDGSLKVGNTVVPEIDISYFFTKNIAAGNEITIFGDGEQTRDFVYAGDIAAGIWAALHTATPNAAYNLSTQTETSLRELVNILSNIAGRRIEPKYGPERAGDIYKSMLSNARARRGLGWKPAVSLEDGLRRTYEYFVNKG